MATLSRKELESFLDADLHAILATNGPSGVPQLTPVWFLYAEAKFYVSAQANTVKVRNLRRDPAMSLCIDGGRSDARYVVVAGQAELVEPGQRYQQEMRRRIIRKYHSSDEAADRYYASVQDSPAVLIVLTPQRILSRNLT